jgi:uncharacterized repeat protein (TIGR03809 family)
MLAGPKERPYELLSHKWRELAERRRAHFIELYRSGRWKHYYTEEDFILRLREAFAAVDAWARLAPDASEPRQRAG